MKPHALAFASMVLAGCAAVEPARKEAPPPEVPSQAQSPVPATRDDEPLRLRCEDGSAVTVRFRGSSAFIEGLPSGPQELLRDAGGVSQHHTVWSNTHLRAEFGLGDDGRQAMLHPIEPPGPALQCRAR